MDDAVPGGTPPPADSERLAEAEDLIRIYFAFGRQRDLAELLMWEYDRRGAEVERLAAAEQALTAHWYRDRDEMLALRIEVERLRAQRDAALAIHKRDDGYVCGGACAYCRDSDEDPLPWPCPTAKALGVTS